MLIKCSTFHENHYNGFTVALGEKLGALETRSEETFNSNFTEPNEH